MIIDTNKKYINKRGEIYFDIKRSPEMEADCPIYNVRCINGYHTSLNENGEAVSNVSKFHIHEKSGLDIAKEYEPYSILILVEIILRRLFYFR